MLKGKVALVTGGTSGIGRAIVERYASNGASIIFNGFISKESAEDIKSSLKDKYKSDVFYHSANLTNRKEIQNMVEEGIKIFGKIDLLVNNAGVAHGEVLWKMPTEKLDEILDVNLKAPFILTKYVVPHMIKNNYGRIINISSILGLLGLAQCSAYSASKHGIIGMTKSLAIEVADFDITVNAICPGFVKTDMVERGAEEIAENMKIDKELVKAGFLTKVLKKRFIEPNEISNLALFLSTEEAKNMTGSYYTLDAGYTAH
jgi:3-hydroxybutyrate dehydrogenase